MQYARTALLISVLCASHLAAQHQTFQLYDQASGLSNPVILALAQDREGFLWVSTDDGIFRYDGDRFEHFRTPSGLAGGYVSSMHVSSDGQFWVLSRTGLFRWANDQFVMANGIRDGGLAHCQLLASDRTHLYVATPTGLFSGRLTSGLAKLHVISSQPSSSVLSASDGTVWFGCADELCSLRNGQERRWGKEQGVDVGPWRAIAEDRTGRLWIRSSDAVLVHEPGAPGFHPIPGLPVLTSKYSPPLANGRSGRILIPHTAGLMVCDGDGCRNRGLESGLRPAEVLSVLEDHDGSLWLGYAGHGLTRTLGGGQWLALSGQEGLGNLSIWRLARDPSGKLWAGTSRGLYYGVETRGRWRFERCPAIAELPVYGLVAERDGTLWLSLLFGPENGLIHYDPRTGTKRIVRAPVPRVTITNIKQDETGTLWIASRKGGWRLRPRRPQLEPVPAPFPGQIRDLLPLKDGGLVLATNRGLHIQRDGKSHLLTAGDGLKDDLVQSMRVGPDGAVWVTYFSPNGITRIDLSGATIRLDHVTTSDGLPSNVVYEQFFDASGRHWVTTDSGAAVLSNGRWIGFDTSDGLVWNDCNSNSFLAEPDGTVWVGTSAGLGRYHPIAQPEAVAPRTLITSILRNDAQAAGSDFDSSTRSVALRFTVLPFKRHNVRFRYRIGTAQSPWEQTASHEIRLAGLAPGLYRFEVQGEAEPGIWSAPALFDFQIRAPWYLSWPFQSGLVAAAGLVVWLWVRQRESRQRRIREQLEAAVLKRTEDLAAATARAEQASRYKGEFLANMSHEMRTPLNGVIGLTQLALECCQQPEVLKHLNIVQVSAKGLLGLINDVLDFSKIESGLMEIAPVAFAVRPLVGEICSMLEPQTLGKHLTLESGMDESIPEWVLADDRRLRQVLVNLIGNALKFTSEGRVSVKATWQAGRLRLTVSDTGIGISAEKQAAIFDAFQQADTSTSRRYGGTGLGLTISKKLVEMMGGRLSVESEPGKGSRFSFTIDAPETGAPGSVEPAGAAEQSAPMNILVAEDNAVNQYLVMALLRKRGHQVAVVPNGVEALAALDHEQFDLVLMDIQMPEMDGLEAVRRIRERENGSGAHLPVIALTARAMVDDRRQILAAGMDGCLDKPIQTDQLDAALNRVCGSLLAGDHET